MFARRRLPFERLSPTEVQRRTTLTVDEHAPFLLDVREPHEWHLDGHITGATLIPVNDLPTRLAELPVDTPIIIYCAHGVRSVAVAEWLTHQGFGDVMDLDGGLHAWKRRGLPVERG